MIKALIFDVGGVLIRTESRAPRANLEARLSLAPGAADLLVFNGPFGIQAQSGVITSQALWASVAQGLSLDDAGCTPTIKPLSLATPWTICWML